jgi:hypothetical protein
MSNKRYLYLDEYDGSLTGLQSNPAGNYDVASPGGLASTQHHWSRGLFGPPERVTDAYAGTGDRYINGEYGNLYVPASHGNVYNNFRGPHSDRTEHSTMRGDPYFWNEKKSSQTKGIEPFEGNTTIEFIEDVSEKPQTKLQNNLSQNKMQSPKNLHPSAPKPQNPSSYETKISKVTNITEPSFMAASESVPKASGTTIIIIVIVILICTELWNETLHNFIVQQLHGGKEVSWVRYGIYASSATILLLAIIYFLNVNFSF